jgi:hypothetical protein
VVNFYIGKQKVVWILKLRENGWEAAASALSLKILQCQPPSIREILKIFLFLKKKKMNDQECPRDFMVRKR